MPAASVEIAEVAWPLPFSEDDPIGVAPSLNVTVPVGVLPAPLTVAVKAIAEPYVDGFEPDTSVVVVVPGTVSVAAVVWVVVPLVPVIVNGYWPDGVEPLGVTVNVVVPEPPVTDDGLKFDVAPVGTPVTVKLTVPVNPPDGVTVTTYAALFPLDADCAAGDAASE